MDRFETMRAFVTVAQTGSFTRAAERLDWSPQLVSKYVGGLERHLGVRLLNRTTRRVALTEAGHRYLQRAQQVLAEVEDMEHELGHLQGEVRGTLRISAPVSFATRHLGPALTDFQLAHPAVRVDLNLTDRKVDLLDEGVDVALRIGALKSSSMIARRLAPIRVVLVGAPSYLARFGMPASPEDLSQHHYLRYAYAETLPEWLAPLQSDPETRTVLTSNNGDVLVQAAVSGAGLAWQPTFICGDALARGDLQVVLPDYEMPPLGLYAVYAHRQFVAGKIRRFVDFLAGYFGDPPYWDTWAAARA